MAALRSSGVFRVTISVPLSSRLISPASVPAGASSMTPVTPRSASVRMHRSQRTGAVTWATSRSRIVTPSLMLAPSALDSRILFGAPGVMPPATAPRALYAGAMNGVERAGHLQGDDAALAEARRRGGQFVERAGRDDLAGSVAVGRVEAGAADGRDYPVRVTAQHRAHAGQLEGTGRGHLLARGPRPG